MKEIKINQIKSVKMPLFVKLEQWKKDNVNIAVWTDPALQAYLKRKEVHQTIGVCFLIIAAATAGVMYGMRLEYELLFRVVP